MIEKRLFALVSSKFTIQGAKVQHFFDIAKYFGEKIYFLCLLLHISFFFSIFALDKIEQEAQSGELRDRTVVLPYPGIPYNIHGILSRDF